MNTRSKIYVLVGHPDPDAFTNAMGEAYRAGALSAGHRLRLQSLDALDFDPILHKGYREIQHLEPDLQLARDNLLWCDHWVIVHPLWWGSAPALLKGFFDRVLLPGFAFQYRENKPLPDKLLKGRSARVLLMSDTPGYWLHLAYGAGWLKILKRQILGFCGVSPVKVSHFSTVRQADMRQRQRWLEAAHTLGTRAG